MREIINAPSLLKPLKVKKTLIDIVGMDQKFKGLKKVQVPPLVLHKCEKYQEERNKALRVIREKIVREMSEKASMIREKAQRKNKEVQFQSDRKNRTKDFSMTQKSLKRKSSIVKNHDSEDEREAYEIEKQLRAEGQVGLSETDVFVLKNVLEVLPHNNFDQKMKQDTIDMDERDIHNMLMSYRSVKSPLKKNKSMQNLTKQTNLTRYDAVKQSSILKSYFDLSFKKRIQNLVYSDSKRKQSSEIKQKIGIQHRNSQKQLISGALQNFLQQQQKTSIDNLKQTLIYSELTPELRKSIKQNIESFKINMFSSNYHKIQQSLERDEMKELRVKAKSIERSFLSEVKDCQQRLKERIFIKSSYQLSEIKKY